MTKPKHPDSSELITMPDSGVQVPYWRFHSWHEVEAMFDAFPESDCMNVLTPYNHPKIDGVFYRGIREVPDQIIAAYAVSEDFARWAEWEEVLNEAFPERRILDETFPQRNGL